MWIVFLIINIIVTVLSMLLVISQIRLDSKKKAESYNYNQNIKFSSEFYLFSFFLSLIPFVNLCYLIGYQTHYIYNLSINKIDKFRNLNEEKYKSSLSDYKKLRYNLVKANVFQNDSQINDFIESIAVYDKLGEN